jgi:hypothetical protein
LIAMMKAGMECVFERIRRPCTSFYSIAGP